MRALVAAVLVACTWGSVMAAPVTARPASHASAQPAHPATPGAAKKKWQPKKTSQPAKKSQPKKKWHPKGKKGTAKPSAAKKQPKRHAPPTIIQGPASFRQPDFAFMIPAQWALRAQPREGKPPRDIRRFLMTREMEGGRAKIELEADRQTRLGRHAVADARGVARSFALTFGYQHYRQSELMVKGAPGYYESWDAQVPGAAPFRVVAAHLFQPGAHYRVAAICPHAPDTILAERDLRAILASWRWPRTPRRPRRP